MALPLNVGPTVRLNLTVLLSRVVRSSQSGIVNAAVAISWHLAPGTRTSDNDNSTTHKLQAASPSGHFPYLAKCLQSVVFRVTTIGVSKVGVVETPPAMIG